MFSLGWGSMEVEVTCRYLWERLAGTCQVLLSHHLPFLRKVAP